jgi:hypothetical protein
MTRPTTLPASLAPPAERPPHGLRHVLGTGAWLRLPAAVRERFADHAMAVTYAGAFEIVRAHWLGRVFAWLGLLFGTPVAPRCGTDVAAHVLVRPNGAGVVWTRVYEWADGTRHHVRSTKVVTALGALVEQLPGRLHMPLRVFESGRVLHFVSLGYYFDLGFGLRLPLPALFSPGVTHVEHIDLGHGWFRFTMTVTHPLFGEMFFQTGRFCATEDGE